MDFVAGLILGYFSLPWFWMGAFGLVLLLDVALAEKEEFAWAGITLAAGAALVAWLGHGVNPFMWVWQNLAQIFLFSLGYLACGSIWSIAKWYLYLLNVRDDLRKTIARWKSNDRVPSGYTSEKPKRPRESYASSQKGRILGWMFYWPFSIAGSIIGDVLYRVLERIYKALAGVYDRISDHLFAEFATEEEND